MFRPAVAVLSTSIAVLLAARSAEAQAFGRMINFGDSLTDVGNTSSQTFGFSPGSNYYNGRYSNGPVWAEGLANSLHLPAVTTSRSGGLDYATGGTHSGPGYTTPITFINLPNAGTQIDNFLGSNVLGANDLVTIWTGANDLLDSNTLDPTAPAANVKAHVDRLVGAGAKNILVVNLPPLGETPRYVNTPDRSAMNTRAAQFNAALKSGLDSVATAAPGVTLYRADMFSLFGQALANPSAYGFTDTTDPALRSDGTVVSNPDQYLFYDTIHPTRAGHVVLANYAFNTVTLRTFATPAATGTNDWNAASTWAQQRVPDSTSNVAVTSNVPKTLSLSGNASVRMLTLGYPQLGTPVGGLGSTTLQLNGGLLSATDGVSLARGGVLIGRGTVGGKLTANTGATFSPGVGHAGATAVDQMTIGGDLNLIGGRIRFDLAATTADRVFVQGAARLEGTIGVRFVNGYIGLPGKTASVLTYNSRTGVPIISNETGYAGLRITPDFGSTTLTLSLSATPGDANLDAGVNFTDLVILAQNYGQIGAQTWLTGDFTGDNNVGFDDLVFIAQNYDAAPSTNFQSDWRLALAIVPEPSCMIALATAGAVASRRRRGA